MFWGWFGFVFVHCISFKHHFLVLASRISGCQLQCHQNTGRMGEWKQRAKVRKKTKKRNFRTSFLSITVAGHGWETEVKRLTSQNVQTHEKQDEVGPYRMPRWPGACRCSFLQVFASNKPGGRIAICLVLCYHSSVTESVMRATDVDVPKTFLLFHSAFYSKHLCQHKLQKPLSCREVMRLF